jgi:transcriptional regulator with XRE-family HTH domain
MLKDEKSGIILKKQLARRLQEKSLTPAELSRRAGVPKQTISDWLGGIAPRNLPALRRIAKVLETSIEQLVFGEPAFSSDSKLMPKPCDHDHEFEFGQELVIITKGGLMSYLSPAVLHVLGDLDLDFQGRPIYELVHIDDIPSMLDWHKMSPHCFRLAGFCGEPRMSLHKLMNLGASDIVIHHLSPILPDDRSLRPVEDFFDLRELLNAIVRILRLSRDTIATNCRVTHGTQPIYVCSLRSLLGRLLLSIVHDMGNLQKQCANPPAWYDEIAIDVEGDDRNFRIRFQSLLHGPMQRIGSCMDLVQACGVNLKFWTTKESRIIEIQGPRIFLTPGLAQGMGQSRKI